MSKKELSIIACLLLLAIIATLLTGPTPFSELMRGAFAKLCNDPNQWSALFNERLPRLLVLLSTGAALAVSGSVMQALFQNPLASPSILGITSGGYLLVTLVILMKWHLLFPYAVAVSAFIGCIATLFIVYAISSVQAQHNSSNSVILTGIAISTLFLAIQGTITYLLRDRWQFIQALAEWEVGCTRHIHWKQVHMQLPLTLCGLYGVFAYRKEMNLLSLGSEQASIMGVDVNQVRFRLFLSVSLLVGGALASVGIIAFYGLLLPHVLRGINGPDNRGLITRCAVYGALCLTLMELSIRWSPLTTFSIGNLSSVIGGVFFIVLLLRHKEMLHTLQEG